MCFQTGTSNTRRSLASVLCTVEVKLAIVKHCGVTCFLLLKALKTFDSATEQDDITIGVNDPA